ncbi:MAG: hypothetical protein ACI9G1_002122 [Pirellulaceae bacterium]|jgi:hypothetical protein
MTASVDREKVTVLYVMGTGRSGSTIFNIAMDNHPQIGGFGELNQLASHGWREGWLDSSGESIESVKIWSDVRKLWERRSKVELEQYIQLQDRYERFRRLRRLARRHSDPKFLAYSEASYQLFRAIRDVSGNDVVLDASKNPFRGYALSLVDGLDVRFIHLIRDPRGVCWSQRKQFSKDISKGLTKEFHGIPVKKTALLWTITNLQSSWVRRQVQYSLGMRYEVFATNPTKALDEVGQLLECDMSPLQSKILMGSELEVGNVVAGNRVRMSKSISLRLDEDWKMKLTKSEERLIWLIGGWLAKKYGYCRTNDHSIEPSRVRAA